MFTRRSVGAIFAAGAAALPGLTRAAVAGTGAAPLAIVRDRTIDGAAIAPGTRFAVAAGATLTITGDVALPATACFAGAGRVDLTASRLLFARPEWWGAVAGEAGVDCAAAIEAALAAHPVVRLGPGDYHLARTLAVTATNRALVGVGRTKDAGGTRLLRHGAGGAVVRVGTAVAPGSINDFVRGVELAHLVLGRTATPAADATGLEVRHVLDARFATLRAEEHAIGFSLRGAVRTLVVDCAAFRSTAGPWFVGFDLDGSRPAVSTGANASLTLVDCLAGVGGAGRDVASTGARLTGLFSDTIVDRFETTALTIGVLVDGQRDRFTPAQTASGHIDLHLRGLILDQCRAAGLRLASLGDAALVDVAQPYAALARGGEAALDLADCGGGVTIGGGQFVGSDGVGVRLRGTSGVTLAGTKIAGFARPVELADSRAFDLNVAVVGGSGDAAVRLTGCAHGTVTARVTGRVHAFTTGIAMDGACDAVAVDTAGIVAAATPVAVAGRPVAPTAGRVFVTAG